MAKAQNTVPKKWTVLRTAENANIINAWLNRTQNLPGYYSQNTKKYITCDTKKGVAGTGPSDSKRNGYTLISFEVFLDQIVNGGQNEGLPLNWVVKHVDANTAPVVDYINRRIPGANLKGVIGHFYGIVNQRKVAQFEPSPEAEVLSLEQFFKLSKEKVEQNAGMVIGERSPRVTAADLNKKAIDYKLIKIYPGEDRINQRASVILPQFKQEDPRCKNFPDYWEPIYTEEISVGDYVIVTQNILLKGCVLKVTHATEHNISTSIANFTKNDVKLASDEEIEEYEAPVVCGTRLGKTGDGRVNIGGSILKSDFIHGIVRNMDFTNRTFKIGDQNVDYTVFRRALDIVQM